MTDSDATLSWGSETIQLPLIEGSDGDKAIDIGKLRSQTGLITYDEGFANTGLCQSSITFLDGEQGILRYRGYPIEQLAEQSTFLEVAYLLLHGELPNQGQYDEFNTQLTRHSLLHEHMRRFFDAFPPDAHPMAIVSSVVCGLSTFYQDTMPASDPEAMQLTINRLLAKVPTIVAMAYRKSRGLPTMFPDNSLDYCSNFLRMMFGYPTEPFEVDPDIVRALEVLLILHADHEQNCSTATVRVVGSAMTNLYASITAGLCALWGPLHGGANQKVLEMLAQIQAEGGDVKAFIRKVKDKSSNIKLMGFGHRVYKRLDPRAKVLKSHCDTILAKLGIDDPLLDIAKELERAALEDSYFIDRQLYPNVDFYSGIIYKSMGFPTSMFTVLFAMGRLPGWISQWVEMRHSKSRIGRPRQVYTGPLERSYIGISDR